MKHQVTNKLSNSNFRDAAEIRVQAYLGCRGSDPRAETQDWRSRSFG